ncbi:GH17264 [Drosophila grimshawi]|uniref:GH17264 n=2 Tax=Drosophila grimshawi TaxID=7222 RepID=B4J296_DROGR|nr:GH17264 [Drosophila grimshawi]
MNQVTILDLNDYCLGRVLKYLQIEDHVNFAETCMRFRDVLRDWSCVLYPEFRIEDDTNFKWKLKLFFIICDVIKNLYLTIDPNKMEFPEPDLFYNHIKTMKNLEFFAYKNEEFPTLKRFKVANNEKDLMVNETFSALEHLPKLKSVSVRCASR